jgi:cell division protein FtsX
MTIALGILSLLLSIALAVSIWYVRGVLLMMYQLTTDIQRMQDDLEEFAKHLNNVYEMEMYYGDETLHSLIRHSKNIVDNINNFKNLFEVENEEETTTEEIH